MRADHVLPLSYFEKEFTRSLLQIERCSNRMDLREIRLIADEVPQEMKAEFQVTFMTIDCDENSLTGMLNMFTLNIFYNICIFINYNVNCR